MCREVVWLRLQAGVSVYVSAMAVSSLSLTRQGSVSMEVLGARAELGS